MPNQNSNPSNSLSEELSGLWKEPYPTQGRFTYDSMTSPRVLPLFFVSVLSIMYYVYAPHECLVTQRPEEELDTLELELQPVVSHHMDAENWTQDSSTVAKALNH